MGFLARGGVAGVGQERPLGTRARGSVQFGKAQQDSTCAPRIELGHMKNDSLYFGKLMQLPMARTYSCSAPNSSAHKAMLEALSE